MNNSSSLPFPNQLSLLTSRERQVLAWLVRGATNRKIGAALKVSPRTIEKHVERILAKLDEEPYVRRLDRVRGRKGYVEVRIEDSGKIAESYDA